MRWPVSQTTAMYQPGQPVERHGQRVPDVRPWMVPDFDLDADLDALLALDRDLRGPHGIALSYRRYLVEARKSG